MVYGLTQPEREEKKERAERAGSSVVADGPPSSLDGVPFGQPALALAAQLQRRAARAGVPDEVARLDDDPSPADPRSADSAGAGCGGRA